MVQRHEVVAVSPPLSDPCVGSGQAKADLVSRRFLPTPCRGSRLPALSDLTSALDLGDLRTLLDSAVQSARDELLEASWLAVRGGLLCEGPGLPLLHRARVPPPTYDLTRPACLAKPWMTSLPCLGPSPFHYPRVYRMGFVCRTLAALSAPGGQPLFADSVCIFADASFDGTNSAWAIFAVWFCNGLACSAKWFASRVNLCQEAMDWIGAKEHGSQQGELSALCGAFLWLLGTSGLPAPAIFSDSLTSVLRATGHCNFRNDDALSASCRSLFQALESADIISASSISHVYSHQGCPWNELADCLAYATASVETSIGTWVRDESLRHLWLLVAACRDPVAWPAHSGGCLFNLDCQDTWDPTASVAWCGLF